LRVNKENTMNLSDRVTQLQPSATIAMTAKAAALRREGKDIISLSAGEPDFDTPEFIRDAAIKAMNNGQTRYTAVGGTPEIKQSIITKLQRDNNLSYNPDQILVSNGGKQCFYNLVMALLNPCDEVLIPAPYWVSFPSMVSLSGATAKIVQTPMSANFKLTAQQLADEITDRTRLLVLNSPSNPSGQLYTDEELVALGDVLRHHPNIIIASDDIYEHIVWPGKHFSNIAMACPELKNRVVVLNGVSKAYAMTGWRIGYAAGPSELMSAMTKIQSQSTSCASAISQAAANAALNGGQSALQPMLAAYKERHDYVVQALNNINGITCLPSDGTFYAFPNVEQLIERLPNVNTDQGLANFLLENAGVALVARSGFGTTGHLRISFAASLDTLKVAISRISKAVEK
jgi:aspartate aminotransferase